MNDVERARMRHALGLDQADKPYRNRYATMRGSDDVWLWDGLVHRGLAVVSARTLTQVIFGVTDEGIAALGVMPLDGLEPNERYKAFGTYSTATASGDQRTEGEGQ